LYFNAEYVHQCVFGKVFATEGLRLIVCDLSNSPYIDVAGAAMLAKLNRDIRTLGMVLRIVEPHAQARDLLRAEGLEKDVGYFGRFMSVDQAILEYEQNEKSTRAVT
jgi:MFS superfamily sulfate permease-like transporter